MCVQGGGVDVALSPEVIFILQDAFLLLSHLEMGSVGCYFGTQCSQKSFETATKNVNWPIIEFVGCLFNTNQNQRLQIRL